MVKKGICLSRPMGATIHITMRYIIRIDPILEKRKKNIHVAIVNGENAIRLISMPFIAFVRKKENLIL